MATLDLVTSTQTLLSHSTSTADKFHSVALSTIENKVRGISEKNAIVSSIKIYYNAGFETHAWVGTMRAYTRCGFGGDQAISKEFFGETAIHVGSTGDKKNDDDYNTGELINDYVSDKSISNFKFKTDNGSYFTMCIQSDNILSKSLYINKVWIEITYAVPTYTITVNSNNTNYGTVSGGGSYNKGSTATITATAKTGYTFSQWNDGVNTNPRNITVTSDATYTAQFTENKYTIAFNGNGNTGGSMSSLTNVGYDDSKTLTANAFTRTGYTFNGWNTKADGSGTSYADKASVSKLSSTNGATVTLYAKWKANSYTIKFNANGGSGSMSDLAMTYGTAKNLTANSFTRTGYDFLGWSKSSTATTATYADKASVNNLATSGTVTLYAVWSPILYTITTEVSPSSGGTVTISGTPYYGENIILTATPNSQRDYEFISWQDNNTSNPRTIKVTGDATYTAVFSKIPRYFTLDPNGGRWGPYTEPYTYEKEYSDVFLFADPRKENHKFLFWQVSGTSPVNLFQLTSGYTNVYQTDESISDFKITQVDNYTNYCWYNLSATKEKRNNITVYSDNIAANGTMDISGLIRINGNSPVDLNFYIGPETNNYEDIKLKLSSTNNEWKAFSFSHTFSKTTQEALFQIVTGDLANITGEISFDLKNIKIIKNTEERLPNLIKMGKGDTTLIAQYRLPFLKFKSVKVLHHSNNEVASPTNPLIGGEDGDQAIIKVEIALE